jgi:hypothetical protein
MMHKYKGADVTSLVTLPVIIFEPMTMLQKMAEVGTLILNEIPLCLHCWSSINDDGGTCNLIM